MHDSRNKTPLLFCIKYNLGILEFLVMKIVWDREKATVREVLGILKTKKNFAYTTIMTVMDNLYKKGFLKREKIKKSYLYFPVAKQNYFVQNSLSYVFQNLISDFGRKRIWFSTLAETLQMPPIGYGIYLTLLLVIFAFSTFDLLQNLTFFDTLDYLGLLLSDLNLFIDKLHLFALAVFESLPVVNILTTGISFILIIFLVKKVSWEINK